MSGEDKKKSKTMKRIAPPTKMKGYVSMKKKKAFAKWHKRFCLLQGACLKYYDEFLYGDDNNVARGVIMLEQGKTVVADEPGDGIFRIVTPQGDEYHFKGDNAQDTSVWAKALQNSITTAAELERMFGAEYKKMGTKEQREQLKRASEDRMRQRKDIGDQSHESFDVTVPEGYEPGDKLRVEHKGRHILVVIPTGVYPGDTFEVRLRKGPQMFKETIQHAGWLDKYPRNSSAAPKPKWFVLTAKALYYMEGEGMPPKQTWDLQGANVVKIGKSKLKFNNPFKDVELTLGCGAEDNQGAWMNRLQLCINMASEVKTADIEKDKNGKVNLLNKQLHGRPVKSGFLKKYASVKGGKGSTASGTGKAKWVVLTSTHLAYMEWEGAPVKKLWNLKGAALFTSETLTEYRLRFCDAERDEVVFACETLDEMMAWNVAIQTGILKNSSDHVDSSVGVKESTIFLPAPKDVSAEDEVLVTLTLENGKTTTVKITCPVEGGKNFKLILKPSKLSSDDLVIIKQEDEAKLKAKHAKLEAEKQAQEASATPPKPSFEADPDRAARRDQRRVARQKFAARPTSANSAYRTRVTSPTASGAPRRRTKPTPVLPAKKSPEKESSPEKPKPDSVVTNAKPSVPSAAVPKRDESTLEGWLQARGCEGAIPALQEIGVEAVDDLDLVTKEDLVDLDVNETLATKLIKAIKENLS